MALAEDGEIIAEIPGSLSGNFSLHTAIQNLLGTPDLSMADLDAVAVTEGPGSYTGLRVGMAAAKGICFAGNLPFITVNTLKMMALAMIQLSARTDDSALFCPMLDARRKEVFLAVYDKELAELLPPAAIIIDSPEWDAIRKNKRMLISGSGAEKVADGQKPFEKMSINSSDLCLAFGKISQDYFDNKLISNVLYTEPFYLKPFYLKD